MINLEPTPTPTIEPSPTIEPTPSSTPYDYHASVDYYISSRNIMTTAINEYTVTEGLLLIAIVVAVIGSIFSKKY